MLTPKTIILALSLLFAGSAFSQAANSRDSLDLVIGAFSGPRFYEGNHRISMTEATNLLRPHPEAFRYLQKAKTNNTLAYIISFAGGALLGYELGSAIGGRKTHGSVIGIGAGLVGLSIPLSIGANRNMKRAVRTYNAGL